MSGKVGNTSRRHARDASLPKVEAQYKIAETYRAEGIIMQKQKRNLPRSSRWKMLPRRIK